MNNEPAVKSFTVKAPHIIHEILTSVEISRPLILDDPADNLKKIQTMALWDTGATHYAITKNAIDKAGLVPTSMAMVAHAGGISYKNVFLVDLHLPNKVTLENLRVTECDSVTGLFDVIIGMDVISLGDFVITNHNNKTTISFRIPSLKEIDFELE